MATKTETGCRAKPIDISSAQVVEKFSVTNRRTMLNSNGCARRTTNLSDAGSSGGSFNRFTSRSGIFGFLRQHADAFALHTTLNQSLQTLLPCLFFLRVHHPERNGFL